MIFSILCWISRLLLFLLLLLVSLQSQSVNHLKFSEVRSV